MESTAKILPLAGALRVEDRYRDLFAFLSDGGSIREGSVFIDLIDVTFMDPFALVSVLLQLYQLINNRNTVGFYPPFDQGVYKYLSDLGFQNLFNEETRTIDDRFIQTRQTGLKFLRRESEIFVKEFVSLLVKKANGAFDPELMGRSVSRLIEIVFGQKESFLFDDYKAVICGTFHKPQNRIRIAIGNLGQGAAGAGIGISDLKKSFESDNGFLFIGAMDSAYLRNGHEGESIDMPWFQGAIAAVEFNGFRGRTPISVNISP